MRGTSLDKYMPKYYYQIDRNGKVIALPDAEHKNDVCCNAENIIQLLEDVGELALKRVVGSLGEGFYKDTYKDNVYYLNDAKYSKDELMKKVEEGKDYLVQNIFIRIKIWFLLVQIQ